MSSPPHTNPIDLSDNARTVLEKRYLRRGPDGKPVETIHEMFWRIAQAIADADPDVEARDEWKVVFYDMLTDLRFLPNSPTFTGAGTPLGQLAACFVLPIEDDMGGRDGGIFQTLRDAALIQQTGGGNGFSFSRLRPKNDIIGKSMGRASGPVSFLQVYDRAFGEIAQGGTRRGANMAVLRVDHPDILEFVNCKAESERAITNFNISVGITDKFMQAVESDDDFDLINPRTNEKTGSLRARELFREIAEKAHHNGEPGVLFLDTANKTNPVPRLYEIEATNPCVTGDTIVMTSEGPKTVLSLINNQFEVVYKGAKYSSGPNGFFHTGFKSVYELCLANGLKLKLTADHRVLTQHGTEERWVAAGDLRIGDNVLLCALGSWNGKWGNPDDYMNGVAAAFVWDGHAEPPAYDGGIDAGPKFETSVKQLRADPSILEWVRCVYYPNNVPDEKALALASSEFHAGFIAAVDPANAIGVARMMALHGGVTTELHGQDILANSAECSAVGSIKPCDKEDVYDVQVPGINLFSANGVIVHNCGEQFLGPYENCCLGSINLAKHVSNGKLDWDALKGTIQVSTRFLDDVVSANAYVPEVPQLREAAERCRRIGLGIMGLADMFYHCGIGYDSDEGREFGRQVMEFVRYHSMWTSNSLAEKHGSFPAIGSSIYESNVAGLALTASWNTPVKFYYGRPELNWAALFENIKLNGIRNAAQTTIAPTGTISTVAGCEGYGCEPAFALAYTRNVIDGDKRIQLDYVSPEFDRAMRDLEAENPKFSASAAIKRVLETGTCQDDETIPVEIRKTFVTSGDISVDGHIRMQAALQQFVDNSISKTINMPNSATVGDVEKAYFDAWHMGCKGLTVYRTGSRDFVVLETKATAASKVAAADTVAAADMTSSGGLIARKSRPERLQGITSRVSTPLGKTYVTINTDHIDGQPFEVFLQASKGGSDTAAVTEAIARLISHILRMASPTPPRDRLADIVRQMRGIGGQRTLGLGPNKVRSLPDGIALMLQRYLEDEDSNDAADIAASSGPPPIGDLCPECGQATYIYAEGCRKCTSCGLSEC